MSFVLFSVQNYAKEAKHTTIGKASHRLSRGIRDKVLVGVRRGSVCKQIMLLELDFQGSKWLIGLEALMNLKLNPLETIIIKDGWQLASWSLDLFSRRKIL